MTFDELNDYMEEAYGSLKLSDIARELGVTPQVVSNWKARNQVPYKYFKEIKSKIDRDNIDKKTNSYEFFNYDFENESRIISILDIIGFLYITISKYKKSVFIIPLIVFTLAFLYVRFFIEPVYKSSAKLLPTTSKSQIGGIASQLGINLGTENNDISSAKLYPDMIRSRTLSKKVLNKNISFMIGDSAINKKLIDFFVPKIEISNSLSPNEIKNKKQRRIESGIRKLKSVVDINYSRVNPLIGIEVKINNPYVAKSIVDLVIESLNDVQNSIKLGKVKEKRFFLENKMAELDKDLKFTEEDLKDFRERNRSINSSPGLLLIQERKQRDISILTQIYISLKQQYEQTLIEEIEGSSMFIVLDHAEVPLKKIGPNPRKTALLLTLFLTLLLITSLAAKDWLYNNWNDISKKLKLR